MNFTSEMLINQAKEATGLEDFGGDTWKLGLETLVHSLNTDMELNEGCYNQFSMMLTQVLVNRLEVQKLIIQHPEIKEQSIKAPIIITGLPRTGTSIAHTFLALDPCARFLRNWESAMAVCPPPKLMSPSIDPRIQSYQTAMDGFFSAIPQLRGINGINFMANGTSECQNLMVHEFVHFGHAAGSSLFSYGEYLSDCDYGPAYRYHKKLLQLLQWKCPNERWVLKAPIHLFGLEALLAVYPDARIVFTHRNPLEAISSGISMVEKWTRFTTGKADRKAIADWWIRLWALALKRTMIVREKLDPGQIFDLDHSDISKAPLNAVSRLYEHFNILPSQSHAERMKAWLMENPRSAFGKHDHGLNQYEEEQVFTEFQFYHHWLNNR